MKRSAKEFFPGIAKIQYEGPRSKNPLAFKHYNADEVVAGKPMKEHLRFSVTYWHTIRGQLADMFGVGTAVRPWEDGTNSDARWPKRACASRSSSWRSSARRSTPSTTATSRRKARTLRETNRNLDAIVKVLKEEQQRTGVQVALGHGLPVCPSALRPRRGDELQRRRVRLRRRAGQEGHRGHARARAAPATSSGAGAKATSTLLNTEPEARDGPPGQVPAPGGRTTKRPSASRASSTSSPSPRSRPSTNTTPTPRPA